jgi:hypothetical protein
MTLVELNLVVQHLTEYVGQVANALDAQARALDTHGTAHRSTRDNAAALAARVSATELRYIKLADRVEVIEAEDDVMDDLETGRKGVLPEDNVRTITFPGTRLAFPATPEPEGYEEYLDRQERLDSARIEEASETVFLNGCRFQSAVGLLKFIRTGKVG